MRIFIAAVLAAVIAIAPAAMALDKREVDAIIKEYIRNHPDEILESVTKYQRARAEAEEEKQFKQSLAARVSAPEDGSPAIGPKDAKIILVEFSDFQCPYCSRASETVSALMNNYKGKIRVVFKHLPLPMHGHAVSAAKASMAANAQGKFWEYHDKLMRGQREWAGLPNPNGMFVQYAKDLSMDAGRFERDMANPDFQKRVDDDIALAKRLAINSTPTFFVNGARVAGARDAAYFDKVIAAVLESDKKKKK